MLKNLIALSVRSRWLVVLLTALAVPLGVWSLMRLPIDAVPDITNNQVQINAFAPALSAFEIEKQVTYPIENAIAGIPGLEYTRSLSRNGFAQVTAVFADSVDIYFARQQVAERLTLAKEYFPPDVELHMGPVATGLSEIYMWSVAYAPRGGEEPAPDGKPGWQSNGDYLTPEGQRLRNLVEMTAYLRTVQDWIIRPLLRTVPGVAGVDSLGGYVKEYHVQPDPAKIFALGLSFADLAGIIERNNISRGAGYVERNGEGLVVRSPGRLESIDDIAKVVVSTRGGTPVRVEDIAEVGVGRELRVGSASMNGEEVVIGTALMLIGANSREVSSAVNAKMDEIRRLLPPGVEVRTILNRTTARQRHDQNGRLESDRGRRARHPRALCHARQFPRRAGDGDGHPADDAVARHRHVCRKDQRQSDESRRARFRIDRRRRDHRHRELPAPAFAASERFGPRVDARRTADHGHRLGGRDAAADRLRAGDHHSCLCADPDLFRGRRENVPSDGDDRHHGACLRIHSFADVLSGDDRHRAFGTHWRIRKRGRWRAETRL